MGAIRDTGRRADAAVRRSEKALRRERNEADRLALMVQGREKRLLDAKRRQREYGKA